MTKPKNESKKRKKDDSKDGEAEDVPRVYRKRKTYGAGARQVAWEEFDAPRRLTQTRRGRSVLYVLDSAFADQPVTITITHNDGSSQTWRIVAEGEEAGTTPGVKISYDDEGRPTSLYILG
jgi:hypothetical protein